MRTRVTVAILATAVAPMAFTIGMTDSARATTVGGPAATGEQIYRTTCVACHGVDGKGAPRSVIGFSNRLPDFTDCNFATRETVADWTAIIRNGGPVRSFSRIMPAFRDLLTPDEIRSVIGYLHTFCRNPVWPRGEFNLPLAQRTEKAFPEDEFVATSSVETQGPGSIENHLIFEKRFGARDQLEVDAPYGFVRRPGLSAWEGGLGDVSLANKYVFLSNLSSGTIVSGLGGIILPTGNQTTGIGNGTTAFEGIVLGAQLLPARSFFQFQGGVELPTDLTRAQRTASWSGALGTTVAFGPITRIWSPMIEATGSRELLSGAPVLWDVVPQFQLSLSALQHVRANVGVDVPVTQRNERHSQLLFYVLWDTFDGGLFTGWRGWCPGCLH
jgi:mono/diheme cytochrome c family protein